MPPPNTPPTGFAWGFPCSFDMSQMCEVFEMVVNEKPSAFIDDKFKKAKDNAMCMGKPVSGLIRYLVNGTSPSSLVGTLFPQEVRVTEEKNDSTGTLEDGGAAIFLTDKKYILGFKATQANWGGGVLTWECSLQ
jgi:hypothetical protein